MSNRQRTARLEARITEEQKALFTRAAELEGRSLTDFVVASLQAAAARTVADHDVIRLSAEHSRAFAAAILAGPKPNDKLTEAFRKHGEWIAS